MNKTYICIDLKTFFASVECVERGLDPFKTNLVVADPARGNGCICLAISPAMKALGIHNRCRVFEIPKDVKYITALPRMKKYIEYSANIYAIYLKYIAKEDIHVYSIDEAFMDVTSYLKLYKIDAFTLAKTIMKDIYDTTGITATCGIGTNLYLTKIALDITAKHVDTHIGYLDEEKYKKELWHHTPLTDFWQVGRGIEKRLNSLGIKDMYDISHTNSQILYKEFGINATYLINHANGIEPCTISDIKNYKSKTNSISTSQILFSDYDYKKARLVLKEMIDTISLDLVNKHLVTNNINIYIGYSKDIIKSMHASATLSNTTSLFSILEKKALELYDKNINKLFPIRRIGIFLNNVVDEIHEQYDLFTSYEETKEEKHVEEVINQIKHKFGKNSILRGMDFEEGATARKRNKLIGGHNAE